MIIREINGKEYSFNMTRKGIRAAEREGFNINQISDKPINSLYYLWYAALYGAHPMNMSKSDELLDSYLDADNTESMLDVFTWLSDEFNRVFGSAVE